MTSPTKAPSFSVKSIRISDPLLYPTCCRRVCLSLYYNNNNDDNAAPSSSIAVLNVSATGIESGDEAGKIDWAVTYRPSSMDHDPLGLLANSSHNNSDNTNAQESVVTCLLAVEKIPSDWLFSNQSQENNNNNNNIRRTANNNNNAPHIFVVVSSNTKEIAKFDPKAERVVSRIRGRHYNNTNKNNNKQSNFSSSYEIRDLLWLPSSNILVVHFSHELELFSCGDSTISLCAVSLQLSPQQQHLFGNQNNNSSNNNNAADEKSVLADPPMLWPLMSGHVQVLQCWVESSSLPAPLLNCRVVTPIVDSTARHVCRCVSLTLPITQTKPSATHYDDDSLNHHFNENHSLVFPFLKRIADDEDEDDADGDADHDGDRSKNNNDEDKSNRPAMPNHDSSNQPASAPLRFPLVFSRIESSCQYGAATINAIDDSHATTPLQQQQQQLQQQQRQQQQQQSRLTTVTTQDIIAHDSNRKPIALCDWTDPGRLYVATRAGTCVHVLEELVVSESNHSGKGMLSIVGGRGSLGDSTRQMTSAVTGWISSWTTPTPNNTSNAKAKIDTVCSNEATTVTTMTVDQINSRRMIQKSKLRRYLVDYNQNLLYSIATSPNRDVLTCGVRTIHYFKNEDSTNNNSSEQNEPSQGSCALVVTKNSPQHDTPVASPTRPDAAVTNNDSNVGLLMNRLDKIWNTASSAVIASVSSAGGNYQWAADYPNNNTSDSGAVASPTATTPSPSAVVAPAAVPIVAMFLPKSNLVVALPIDMKSISWLRKNISSNNGGDAAIVKTQNLL